MIIKNSIATSTALVASFAVPAGALSLAVAGGSLFGLFGGAAFTSALCALGWLVGMPTLVGGLLGLLLLQVMTFLVVFLLMQLTLAWMPV
ncbi:hypothetical protein H6F76_05830 [Leptolyngbya sp. FACHB-321]|uniref:hypothetical protein n=1 Tax=Leptolyngbya sp. FACHB-321 TaxID=2692807 RepID=UPI0016858AB5|nr:hypothetical protein [Leptolyngbya sp. FACHB-321]MBD2034552.1 hypothetical protein [Leptolyngbya sp. FACHB-321]